MQNLNFLFVLVPELTDDYSDVSSDVLIHPFNQSYLTYYNSVFNARFWATVTEEFRALYGILQKKKGQYEWRVKN